MQYQPLTAARMRCTCTLMPTTEVHGCIAHAGDVSGPIKWSGVCTTGERQSPIDVLAPGLDENYTPLYSRFGNPEFMYQKSKDLSVLNTGHGTMQVGLLGSVGIAISQGKGCRQGSRSGNAEIPHKRVRI